MGSSVDCTLYHLQPLLNVKVIEYMMGSCVHCTLYHLQPRLNVKVIEYTGSYEHFTFPLA